MKKQFDPKIHHRRSIRLKGYDYAQSGFYFITTVVKSRTCLFGKIEDGKMILNPAGDMIAEEWLKLKSRFLNIELHESVVMPNHFHGILEILPLQLTDLEESAEKTDNKTLGEMIGAFESITTVEYIRGVKTKNWTRFEWKLWQRNYWEHIIRSERSFWKIANYIIDNPKNWEDDKFFT